MSEPLVHGTDFVVVPTKDFEGAVAFYEGILGLETLRYEQPIGGEFETGNLTLQVIEMEKIGREVQPSPNPIALHVDDVHAARERLQAQGVEFEGEILDSGVCYQAFFRDPDGNMLALHHRYAPRRRS